MNARHFFTATSIGVAIVGIAYFLRPSDEWKPGRAEEIAWKATERFHQEFNNPGLRDFHVLHGISGDPEVISNPLPAHVSKARMILGEFRSASVKSCKTAFQPSGIVVTFVSDSAFERGTATERISFLVTGTSAVPWGYSIESPLLGSP